MVLWLLVKVIDTCDYHNHANMDVGSLVPRSATTTKLSCWHRALRICSGIWLKTCVLIGSGPVPCSGIQISKKMFLPHSLVKNQYFGSLRDREVACSASDRQWGTVSSAGGLKSHLSTHLLCVLIWRLTQHSRDPHLTLKTEKFSCVNKILVYIIIVGK